MMRGCTSPDEIEAHLKRFPNGQLVALARERPMRLSSANDLDTTMRTRIKDSRDPETIADTCRHSPRECSPESPARG